MAGVCPGSPEPLTWASTGKGVRGLHPARRRQAWNRQRRRYQRRRGQETLAMAGTGGGQQRGRDVTALPPNIVCRVRFSHRRFPSRPLPYKLFSARLFSPHPTHAPKRAAPVQRTALPPHGPCIPSQTTPTPPTPTTAPSCPPTTSPTSTTAAPRPPPQTPTRRTTTAPPPDPTSQPSIAPGACTP